MAIANLKDPGGGLIPLTIGVTGHRDLLPAQHAGTEAAVRRILLDLAQDHPATPLRLLSPLAEGADRLVARVFLSLRAERLAVGDGLAHLWELVLPQTLPDALFFADFPDSIHEFEQLRSQANLVFEVPARHGETVDDVSRQGAARDRRYLDAGLFVARHCHILIALWDGQTNNLVGGTANITRLKLGGYAEQDFDLAGHYNEYDCGPVYHVAVGRAQVAAKSGDDPAASAPSGPQTRVLVPDDPAWDLAYFARSFADMDQVNRKIASHLGVVEASAATERWRFPDQDTFDRLEPDLGYSDRRLIHTYRVVDELAINLEGRRRRYILALYLLGGGIAACLVTAQTGLLRYWMIAGYLLSFAAVGLILVRLKARRFSQDLLLFRVLAESLRVQFYWSVGGVHDGDGRSRSVPRPRSRYTSRVLDTFLGQQSHEIGWVREALRTFAFEPQASDAVAGDLRTAFSNFWVEDQNGYFSRTHRRYEGQVARLGWVGKLAYILGIGASAIYVLGHEFVYGSLLATNALAIGAAALPALALLLQGYLDKMAFEEQANTMGRLEMVFRRARRQLSRAGADLEHRAVILRNLGTEAIAETANWLLLKKGRVPNVPG